MKFRNVVGLAVCSVLFAVSLASPTFAQDRSRVVTTSSSRPINQPTTSTPAPVIKTLSSSKPVLTNEPVVQKPLVEKTGSSSAANAMTMLAGKASHYNTPTSSLMLNAINARLGIPYHYGSEGPNSYDCSGFVWSVFQAAGFKFDRSSAANYWNEFEPVTGDDQYKFGTLVFFNGLGHVGIVVDKDGFYQASSSKGITYSKFAGYWEKRITGFRRVPVSQMPQLTAPTVTAAAASSVK
jgi:cell wall-associated NlpC family hydrolase